MQVEWVGNKKALANAKHFNNTMSNDEMDSLVRKVVLNATHVGQSDRANAGHIPAKIIWGDFNGKTYAIVVDGNDVRKNKLTIVSFYDVHNKEHKAARFNMKEVK